VNDSLKFWWRIHTASSSYVESLLVRVSSYNDVSDTSRYLIAGIVSSTNNTTWWRTAIDLTPYAESLYIAFYYKNYNDWGVAIDDVRVEGAPSSIEEQTSYTLPLITALNGAKPNPVKGNAYISFSIASPSITALRIYDASGRLVKTLINNRLERGNYNHSWNGTDDNNHAVAEGIYFYTLKTENYSATKKLVMTR
jgi:hypothetical protein